MSTWDKILDGSADINFSDSIDGYLSDRVVVRKKTAKTQTTIVGGGIGVGSRVKIKETLESSLMYPTMDSTRVGTIVRLKTASLGMSPTSMCVMWDDREVSVIDRRYIEPVMFGPSGNYMKVTASQMSDFIRSNGVDNGLVHKSSHDLWSVSGGEDGGYTLERLFDPKTGIPLKEEG